MQLTLTGKQIRQLADMVQDDNADDADAIEISVGFTELGYDGPGLYAWYTDYPEEGGISLFDAEEADSGRVERTG